MIQDFGGSLDGAAYSKTKQLDAKLASNRENSTRDQRPLLFFLSVTDTDTRLSTNTTLKTCRNTKQKGKHPIMSQLIVNLILAR